MHTLPSCKFALFSLCLLLFLSITAISSAAPLLPADLKGENVPFLPYLEYTLDEKGSLDIEAVSLQEGSLHFEPLHPLEFDTKTGVYWLRFTLGPLAEGSKPVEWLLALGESLPGDPQLFVPEIQSLTGMQQWRVSHVTDRHILTLPEAGSDPKTCYIRLAGPPGLWFSPTLRSPHNAANNWGALAHPAAVLALCVILLLCLIRSFTEHGQWRIWTALFVAGALASGYLGLPSIERGHIGFNQFLCVLAPGIALMLLPHIARYMLQSAVLSRLIDAQLIVLTLVGAAVTLLPLVPGCAWIARALEIWPLCTIFFIPTALWALFLGLPASQRFLLVCLLPPLFTAAGILGLLSGFPADLFSALPLCGIALSALILVASPNPKQSKKKDNKEHIEETITLNELEDPNLRLVSIAEEMPAAYAPKQQPEHESSTRPALGQNELELLQEPVEALFTEAKQLEGCALPPAVRAHAHAMVEQAKRLVNIIHGVAADEPMTMQDSIIDLQMIMRDVYNKAVQVAQHPEIALGWYMPPDLPALYTGNARLLRSALEMLVESAVRATDKGSVHFTVQTYPESDEPGHLLFAITDTGKGMPPKDRSGLAITKAWEVAGSAQGSLSLESSSAGTTVYFSVRLEPQHRAETTQEINRTPLVLIASEAETFRSTIPPLLKTIPCRVATSTSLQDALDKQNTDPAALIIAHDTLATPLAQPVIMDIKRRALNQGLPFCKLLAITKTDIDWKKLGEAGYTLALLEPLDEEALFTTVQDCVQDFKTALGDSQTSANSNQRSLPLPDLFGTGAGRVPKHIDDLKGLASLVSSFSSLPNREGMEMLDLHLHSAEEHNSELNQPQASPHINSDVSAIKQDISSFEEYTVKDTFEKESVRLDTQAAPIQDTSEATEPDPVNDPSNGVPSEDDSLSREEEYKRITAPTAIAPDKTESQTKRETTNNQQQLKGTDSEIDNNVRISEIDRKQESSTTEILDEKSEPASFNKTVGAGSIKEKGVLWSISSDLTSKDSDKATVNHADELPSIHITIPDAKPIRLHWPQDSTEQKQSVLPENPEASQTKLRVDEWVGETVPVADRTSNSADNSATMQSFTSADEWVGEPVPVQPSSKNEKDHRDNVTQKRFTEADEWVGEPVPMTDRTSPASENINTTRSYTAADEWVGEPVPVQPSSKDEKNHRNNVAQKRFTEADEWVGEPVPVTDRSSLASENIDTTRSYTAADEWVGEPVPVQPSSKKENDYRDNVAQKRFTEADEWVGKPVPVIKTQKELNTPTLDSAAEIIKEDSRSTNDLNNPDISPLHAGRDWAENWENVEIPLIERAQESDQVKNDSDIKTTEEYSPLKNDRSEQEGSVLDYIEGAVEKDTKLSTVDPIQNATSESLKAQSTPKEEGRGPDPALLAFVDRLENAVEDAQRALAAGHTMRVAEAAGRIASECDAFSFRVLARIARCVEQAGKAGDRTALKDLLPELVHQIERSNIALKQIR